MTIEVNFSKSILDKYINATSWMLKELQKTKKLVRSFCDHTTINKALPTKESFIRAFLDVYNHYAYYKHMLHIADSIESIDMYCKQLGSHRDLQCYRLMNSSAERFAAWYTNDYRQLCIDLSKKLSSTEIQNITHDYFVFLAYEKPTDHGLDTFFEYDSYNVNVAPHTAYCNALFEKNYRVYTGLKAEHEYIIKPITLEVVKNANNYYKKLYNSMSN